MHTDEQHEPSDSTPDPEDGGGLRVRLRAFLAGAAAWLRDALGADSLSGPAGDWDAGRSGRPPGRDARGDASPPEAAAGTGELTASRTDGHLRVSDGDGAYIESDTWEEVER
ncbi:hypothetical protein [Salinirussus salinus]|jgi:hypothetical protein|uniref:hypothetical protein n=1 Tax=Salinirussus salinus TaxID=1198300 RepID=UPI0013591ED0|nr:hypothetical protein [Salinirussus salinus]